MNRIKAAIWVLRAVVALLVAVACARKDYRIKRSFVGLRRSMGAIDANLAEIERLRGDALLSDELAAERARREFSPTELAEIAKCLQLTPKRSR